MNKVKIIHRINEKNGVECSIQINGEEMSSKIQGLTLEMDALSIPTLVLRMPVDEIEVEVDCKIGKKDSLKLIENIATKVSNELGKKIECVLCMKKQGEVDEK